MSDVTITTHEGSVATDLVPTVITVASFEGRTGATGPAGDPGDPGDPGQDGVDGTGISAAAGAPVGSGNAGDLYVNTTNGDLYRFS